MRERVDELSKTSNKEIGNMKAEKNMKKISQN